MTARTPSDWVKFTGNELDELRRTPTRPHRPQMQDRYRQSLLDKEALERVRPGVYRLTPLGCTVRSAALRSYQLGHQAGQNEERREAVERIEASMQELPE